MKLMHFCDACLCVSVMKQASYQAALLSAGCALNIADEVLSGQVENLFVCPLNAEGGRCFEELETDRQTPI